MESLPMIKACARPAMLEAWFLLVISTSKPINQNSPNMQPPRQHTNHQLQKKQLKTIQCSPPTRFLSQILTKYNYKIRSKFGEPQPQAMLHQLLQVQI
jgi:hypothetical protein